MRTRLFTVVMGVSLSLALFDIALAQATTDSAKPAAAKLESAKPTPESVPPKPAEPKAEPKPAEPKPADTKPVDTKPVDTKPVDTKPDESKAAEAKPADMKPEDLFGQGRDALFKGQYDQAIDLLAKAIAADPSKTSYRLHLARAYRYAGKDDSAMAQLEEILKTAPDHVEAGQALAEIHTAAQRWQDAVRVLEPLLKYRHDYPTYHMLAEAYYNLSDQEKARKAYEEAIKLNPQSAADQYQLGNIYLSGNFFALAADSYQSALRLGLDTPVLRYKLGSAYFNLRNYFGVVSVQTVKSGKPGTISGPWYLIEAAPGGKDLFRCAPEASAIYQVARALADGIEDRADIHVLQATIYLNARRFAQAYEMFKQIAPTVKDDQALFHYYYAQAALGVGKLDEYLSLLREAIRLDAKAYQATLVDAYVRVADQYNQAGQFDKYIEFLAQAVSESPQAASLHLKLGHAYEDVQNYDQAVSQWQMVLDLEPDHPQRMELLNLIQKHRAARTVTSSPGAQPKPSKSPPEKPAVEKPARTAPTHDPAPAKPAPTEAAAKP